MNKYKRDENGLNKRERAILKYIEMQLVKKGYAPSVREIGAAVGLSSTATVQGYLNQLEKKGFIKKEKEKGRTLRIVKNYKGESVVSQMDGVTPTNKCYTSKEMVNVPIVGQITAGQPILAVENIVDTFPLPVEFMSGSDAFMLTVKGESMIEAGIFDGDYILINKQNTCNNGEIVVALIEDEATVKTFYKEKNFIRLQPENSSMKPIIVPDCQILGKVIGVFRKM